MTAKNNKSELPAGFTDITNRVNSTMAHRYRKMKIEDESGEITFESISFALEAQKAVDHILRHVVKYQGDYLTCFADNKPIFANDLQTVVDACAMNTNSLSRKMICHVLETAPLSFQRHQYCPGFPRFMSVDGATTYNTWHPVPRLQTPDGTYNKWVLSKETARNEVAELWADGVEKADVIGVFEVMTTPIIWRVMQQMLFGNHNSGAASDDWSNERDIFTRWFACCVHRPLERIRWSPVVRGAHGVGKGTFQHMAKALMGSGSVNVVHDIEGIAGRFSGEKALTRLLVVDECWSKSGKAMEQFKPIVSEDYVHIERKGEQPFSTRATHNTIVFSNHHIPFVSAETERRWWVPNYRQYDLGEGVSKDENQAFHAEGNRLIRKAMPLGKNGDQRQLRDVLCWLKLVADLTPVTFFTKAPRSEGFMDLVDLGVEDSQDHLLAWLIGLGSSDAFSLAQVVKTASVPQSELVKLLSKYGFRDCQMKRDGNRKVWTKSPLGVGPKHLVEYAS